VNRPVKLDPYAAGNGPWVYGDEPDEREAWQRLRGACQATIDAGERLKPLLLSNERGHSFNIAMDRFQACQSEYHALLEEVTVLPVELLKAGLEA
jgi:hypothetical protein